MKKSTVSWKVLVVVALMYTLTLGFMGNSFLSQTEPNSQVNKEKEEKLEKVKKVQKDHERALFSRAGVTAVGVGLREGGAEDDFSVDVYFNPEAPGAAAGDIPLDLEGVAVRIVESDEFKAHDGGPNHRLQFATPVPMGVSTSNDNGCFAGTLGVRVFRNGSTSRVGYITNAHVASAGGPNLCPGQAAFGEDQFQRGRLDTFPQCSLNGVRRIGDLVQHIPIVFGGLFENTVDAAFVASSRLLVNKTILDIGNPSPAILAAALNMPVQKSGRTTGRQFGTITSINVTANVGYGGACGTAKFVGQIAITPGSFSDPGDSGSLILHRTLKDSANRFRPVGLLFAGSSTTTLANPIGNVLGALASTIDTF
jgi:hypothetical protein